VIVVFALVVTALVYLRGWPRACSLASGGIPPWRAGCFLAGLASIGIASASPLAHCDAGSLTVHMIQHLLLQAIAPPLIFLGEPLLALGHGMPRPLRRVGSALDQPVLCWLAATITLIGWHVPAAFTLAMHSHSWHTFEHVSFLATGLLFWWPVIRPWPLDPTGDGWPTVLYLFLATLPCDILSGFLVFSDRVAYPAYLSARSSSAVLSDQQCAGALMWTVVTVLYLAAGAILSVRLLTRSVPQGEVA
jgi:cytochrome c oxidase assembly factor CtaG